MLRPARKEVETQNPVREQAQGEGEKELPCPLIPANPIPSRPSPTRTTDLILCRGFRVVFYAPHCPCCRRCRYGGGGRRRKLELEMFS